MPGRREDAIAVLPGLIIGSDVVGGTPPSVLFIASDTTLGQDPTNFGYTTTAGLYLYKESTVGFLQTPQVLDIRHTIKAGSSSFGIPSVVESLLTDEAGAVDSLGMSVYKASCEITHTSGTYTTIDIFSCAPSFTGSGTTSALRYFNAANYTNGGSETIGLVTGLYIGFSGSSNYGYYNSGTASNLLGVTGSKTYQGSSLEVVMFYDSDGYWKFDQNTVAPLGMWVNSTGGQMDFIHSGDADPSLFYSNSINDTIGIGTDGSDDFGKLDIRPLLTNRTALYIQYATNATAPYILMQDSALNDTFQIRRGAGQIDDLYPQLIGGKPTPTIGAIADAVPNAFWIVNGETPAIILCSTVSGGGGSYLAGDDSGSPLTTFNFIRTDTIFGTDDTSSIVFAPTLDVVVMSDWTATSNEYDQFFQACAAGSITPVTVIRLSGSNGLIVNDAPTNYTDFRIKSPSEDYFVFFDVSTGRGGMNTSSPGATFDVNLPGGTDDGIQVQANTAFHDGDFFRALTSAGDRIFQFKLNNINPNDADSLLYIGDPTSVQTSFIENLFGGAITNSSHLSPIIASVLRTDSGTERPVFGFGRDTGVVVGNSYILGDFIIFGNDTTTHILPYTFDRLTATAAWSSGYAPFDRKFYSAPTSTGTLNLRMWLANTAMIINDDRDQDWDFIVRSDGSDYMIFSDSGNNRVGIGTNTPGYELDVNGTVRAQSGLIIGNGASGIDYLLTFDGENSNGTIKWLEDEGIFQVNSCSTALPNSPLLSALSGTSYFSAVGTVAVLASISTTSLLSSSIYVGKSSGVAAGNNETLHQNIIYGNTGASTIAGNIYHSIVADDSGGWAVGSSGFRQDFWVVADGSSTPHATPAITIRQNNRVGVQQSAPSSYFEVGGSVGFLATASSATSLTLADSGGYIFTGGSATTWTLPALASTNNRMYFIKNRGSANITLQRAGSDQLYTTSAVNSITIAAGESYIIYNDATYWNVM